MLIAEDKDTELIESFFRELGEPNSTVLIFKLVHKGNEQFYKIFKNRYHRDRTLSKDDELFLQEVASRLNIDYYQQERMKIDIMYKHHENKVIVDEYRDILISGFQSETLMHSQLARLRRLRTLRVRNNIPSVLFETLDEFLLKGKKIQEADVPEYLKEARSILENLFFKDPILKGHLIEEDIEKLIWAKHNAYLNGDMGFEQILLDVGKACDEAARLHKEYSLLEEFSSIVTYFDRYDHVQASMSQIAFMENWEFSDDFVRSLLGNMKEFEALKDRLFHELFINSLLHKGENSWFLSKVGYQGIEGGDKGSN
jgi:uncharacterized protein (TIGR04442 family)